MTLVPPRRARNPPLLFFQVYYNRFQGKSRGVASEKLGKGEKKKIRTRFVSNCKSFDIFYSKFDHSSYLKFVQNITSFVVDCFINTKFSKIT